MDKLLTFNDMLNIVHASAGEKMAEFIEKENPKPIQPHYNYPVIVPQPMIEYKSGMRRSIRKPRFDLIDSDWLRGVACVMTEGCEKYGANNWRKGDRDAAVDAANHLFDHLLLLKDGDMTEQHIYNLSCNAMFISYYLQLYPDLFQDPRIRRPDANVSQNT